MHVLYPIKSIQEVILDVWVTWKQIGLIRTLNRLYSVKGFEKGSAVLIPLLELINDLKIAPVDHWLTITKNQKDLYDASLVVIWKIHQVAKAPSISTALSAIGDIVKTGEILKRYEIANFETCCGWASQIGSMRLFHHPTMQNFLIRPHRFFYLIHSLYEIKSAYSPPAIEDLKTNKREQLLKTVFHIGMIAIILTENCLKEGTTRWGKGFVILFRLLEIGTHSTNLIQFLIK